MSASPFPTLCNQHGCSSAAVGRFTWPGREEQGICQAHLPQLLGVADAIGLHLQVVPLPQQETQEPNA